MEAPPHPCVYRDCRADATLAFGAAAARAATYVFNPPAPGDYHSRLTIQTDANAAFGTAGDTYTIDLYGRAVPEPSSLALIGLGGLALLRRRRSA